MEKNVRIKSDFIVINPSASYPRLEVLKLKVASYPNQQSSYLLAKVNGGDREEKL
ncbi:MAG TPA: hypothetical protein VJJ51_11995 [Candidatus Methanoperedens sp.]|nr:hypothetical protein [Candidatus Methanoperedens sp.]